MGYGGDNPELGHVGPQRIDQCGALAHQQVTDAVRDELSLLGRCLCRDETHAGPLDRLAACLGIGAVVLVALHVRLHVLGRHLSHVVSAGGELATPVMRRRAGFEADETWRQRREELHDVASPQAFAEHYRSFRTDAVDVEHVFGDVEPDSGNLVHGWPPR
jgi:hypothetical protein